MKYKGLSLTDTRLKFENQDFYSLAYQDPNSITWSWLVWWTPPWRTRYFYKWYSYLLGSLHVAKQDKMYK